MSNQRSSGQAGGTRYRHTGASGGSANQGERKDAGWTSRQGGRQSREPGRRSGADQGAPGGSGGNPGEGTNTQGGLAGIGAASRASADRLEQEHAAAVERAEAAEQNDLAGALTRPKPRQDPALGTDRPPRMGGPLGADPHREDASGGWHSSS